MHSWVGLSWVTAAAGSQGVRAPALLRWAASPSCAHRPLGQAALSAACAASPLWLTCADTHTAAGPEWRPLRAPAMRAEGATPGGGAATTGARAQPSDSSVHEQFPACRRVRTGAQQQERRLGKGANERCKRSRKAASSSQRRRSCSRQPHLRAAALGVEQVTSCIRPAQPGAVLCRGRARALAELPLELLSGRKDRDNVIF